MRCPCGRKFRVKPDWAGRTLKCSKCERSLKVPEALRAEREPASEPERLDCEQLSKDVEARLENAPPPALRRTLSPLRFRRIRQTLHGTENSAKAVDARREALGQLGRARDVRALELIVAQTGDPSPPIREAAAAALGDLQHPSAVPPLLRMLGDELAMVRQAALAALGKSSCRYAVRPLLLFARYEPQMRFLACEAVYHLGEAAVPELVEILTRNEKILLLDAVTLLGRLGEKRAAKSILGLLNLHLPAEVRRAAAEALGQIGDSRCAAALRGLLRDPVAEVRAAAVAALAKMPDASNVAALIEVLRDEHQPVVAQAATALGEIGDAAAAPHVSVLLDSEDGALRLAAAESLARLGDARALPVLVQFLKSEDERVLFHAVAGLKRLHDPRTVEPLLGLLDHARSAVRQRAIDALGQIGDAAVAERLEVVLKEDRSEEVRAAAARALGEIADPISVGVLLDALRDDFVVRCRACIALGLIGDETALPGLVAMLKDGAPEVRFHAATALGQIGSANAVPALKQRLAEDDSMAQRGLLKALEALGEPQDEGALNRRKRLRRTKDAAIYVRALLPDSPRARSIVAGALSVVLVIGFFWSGGGVAGDGNGIVVRGNVASVSFGRDGTRLAAGRSFGLVELWDLESQQVVARAELGPRIAFASDGKTIAAVRGANVVFWEPESSASPSEQAGHEQPIVSMVVAAGGKYAATISGDGVVVVWDLIRGRYLSAAQIPAKNVQVYGVSPDGELVATGDSSGTIGLWNSTTAAAVQKLTGPPEPVRSVAFSGDGGRLAAAFQRQIIVWDLSTGRPAVTLEVSRPPSLLGFQPGSEQLASVAGSFVDVWDLATGKAKELGRVRADGLTSLDFSLDGKRLAVGGDSDAPVWVFDLQTGKVAHELDVAVGG